jgi:hypothetical protein
MKSKRIVLFGLIILLVVLTVFTVDVIAPKKVEANPYGVPGPIQLCCMMYAAQCPGDVQPLCYSDCMEYNCGY